MQKKFKKYLFSVDEWQHFVNTKNTAISHKEDTWPKKQKRRRQRKKQPKRLPRRRKLLENSNQS